MRLRSRCEEKEEGGGKKLRKKKLAEGSKHESKNANLAFLCQIEQILTNLAVQCCPVAVAIHHPNPSPSLSLSLFPHVLSLSKISWPFNRILRHVALSPGLDSSASTMKPSGHLISVHPEELNFEFELDKPSYCNLKVVNNTEHHVAFKVKTTSPRKYFVRPNTSVVQPWDSCTITVTLQAQKEFPSDMQSKDKFLLQSTKVPPSTDIDEIPADTFNKEGDKVIEECKLRVVYTIPSQFGHGNSDRLMNSSVEEIQTVQRLKEERDSTLQQNKILMRELEMLKRRRSRKGDSGFSLTFAAFAGLIGLMVGFILNLALSSPQVPPVLPVSPELPTE